MNFQNDMMVLETALSVFNRQADLARDSWNDNVQRKFYAQFIEMLPAAFNEYLHVLQTLDDSFGKAEEAIEGLS